MDSLKTVLDFYGSNIEVCDICFHKSCVILSLNDEYEILDKTELEAGVAFYRSYFYGVGERSILLNHLEIWPLHANWLIAEILFFLKNHDQDRRWPNGGVGYHIRDDQIWLYVTTGVV